MVGNGQKRFLKQNLAFRFGQKAVLFLILFFAQRSIQADVEVFKDPQMSSTFLESSISSPREFPPAPHWSQISPTTKPLSPVSGKSLWLKIQIPPTHQIKDPVLTFERIYTRFDYFVNEQKLHSFGHLGGYPGVPFQILELPSSQTISTVYLKVDSKLARIGPLGSPRVAARSDVVASLIRDDAAGAFVVSVLFLIGLSGIVLFAFHRNVKTYLYLALFSISAGFYFFARLRSRPLFEIDPVWSGALGLLGLYATPCFFVGFYREIFSQKFVKVLEKMQWAAAIFSLTATIGSFLTPTGPLDFLFPFYAFAVPMFSYVLYHSVRKLSEQQDRKTFFAGLSALFLAGLWEAGREAKLFQSTVQVFQWGFLAFVLSLVTLQGRFFAGLFALAHENAVAAAMAKERLERVLTTTQELAKTHSYKALIHVVADALVSELDLASQNVSIDFFISVGESAEHDGVVHHFRYIFSKDDSKSELFEIVPEPVGGAHTHQASKVTSLPGIFSKDDALAAGIGEDPTTVLTIPLHSMGFLGAVAIRKHGGGSFKIEDRTHLTKFVNSLSASLMIALQNLEYVTEVKQKAVIDHEIDAAMTLQAALLPEPMNLSGIDYSSFCRSAGKTGGDWYGYFHSEKRNRLYITVGDVTGHDFAASIMTGVAAGAVKAWEQNDADHFESAAESLEEVASVANRVMCASNKGLKFMTMVFICLEIDNGRIWIVNAGHPQPFLISSQGKLSPLICAGNLLGQDENSNYKATSHELSAGDSIFIYTDGLFENKGPTLKSLTKKMFSKAVVEPCSSEEMMKKVLSVSQEIWLDYPADDDVTMVAIKWCPAAQGVIQGTPESDLDVQLPSTAKSGAQVA